MFLRCGDPRHQQPFAAEDREVFLTRMFLFRKDPGSGSEGGGGSSSSRPGSGGVGGINAAAAAAAATTTMSTTPSAPSPPPNGVATVKDLGPYPRPVDPEAVKLKEKADAKKAKEKAAMRVRKISRSFCLFFCHHRYHHKKK